MWKDALLQVLVALWPMLLFPVWYDRSERTRHVPAYFSLTGGIALFLGIWHSASLDLNPAAGYGLVTVWLGALYGGVPAAAALAVLYGGLILYFSGNHGEFVYILMFFLLFFPLLCKLSPTFRRSSREKKLRQVFLAGCGLLFFQSVFGLGNGLSGIFLHAASFLVCLAVGMHFIEIGFERVSLKRKIQTLSPIYRGELHLLKHFFDLAPLAVLFLDMDGKVTHINETCLRLLAPFNRRGIVGRHCSQFAGMLHFENPSPIDRVMHGEEKVSEFVRLQDKTFYTLTSLVKGFAGQSPEGVLVMGHDVTELQRLRDEMGRMDRLSLVGQMAASITHEIRNPMAVIRGFVQLMNERSSAEHQTYFRIVMEELDRANAIISDFLSLAQNRVIEKELCSLHDILHEVMPLIEADANMRGQLAELRLCGIMEPLELSSKEIKQMLLNLARNGMEAMSDNGVLRIETANLADIVQIRVSDQGVGIPKEALDRLFEPFFTTKSNGTGLGLALCLSIAERHNGKIQVESTVGKGTTFIVSFCKPSRQCW